MEKTKVKDVRIDGKAVAVFLTYEGKFYASLDGQDHTSESLKALLDALRKQVRIKRAKVEVTILDGWGDVQELVDGFLTGIHARTGAFLFESTNGQHRQIYRPGDTIFCRLTKEQRQRYLDLQAIAKKAEQAFKDYKKSLVVYGHTLLAEAQEKA